MSSIPNLNTLRSGRRGSRLRGRRGGSGAPGDQDGSLPGEEYSQQAADKVVQQTDGDANTDLVTIGQSEAKIQCRGKMIILKFFKINILQ